MAFAINCSGMVNTVVTATYASSEFHLQPLRSEVRCGQVSYIYGTFWPAKAGLTTADVTFQSPLGTTTKTLIGNGVPVSTPEQWMADLPAGTVGMGMAYDRQREYLYISDYAMHRVSVW